MNLFISSFKRELKVVTVLVCLLLAAEVGIRLFEDNLSIDVKHYKAIPQILDGFQTSKARNILFMGNSLTRRGVDLEVINGYWSEHNLPKTLFQAVYPDATTITDWYYLFRYNIEMRHIPVDLIVISFARNWGVAQDQLADQAFHSDRLGGYFGGWAALAEAFTQDITTVEDRVAFLLSCLSKIYVNRERVKKRVLSALIPNYREYAQVINTSINQRMHNSPARPDTYNQVKRLLAAARSQKITVVFVAMPSLDHYQINNSLKEAIHDGGGFFLDLRNINNLQRSDYLDGFHLSPHGAKLYSSRLLQEILSNPELRQRLKISLASDPLPKGITQPKASSKERSGTLADP